MRATWILTSILSLPLLVSGAHAEEPTFVPDKPAPETGSPLKGGSPAQVSDQPRGRMQIAPLSALPRFAPTDKPDADLKKIREWVIEVVTDASEKGTDIYNQKAYLHAYLYFQATLLSVMHYLPMFDQPLAKRAQTALARSTDVQIADWQAAIALRTALNDIRNRIKTAKVGDKDLEMPLWERLGGEDTVRAIVRRAFDAAYADPKVNFTRNGDYPYTATRAERLEQLGMEAIRSLPDHKGGKCKEGTYSGRDMERAHLGMNITPREFDAALKKLVEALQLYCVPEVDIEELMKYVKDERKNIVGK